MQGSTPRPWSWEGLWLRGRDCTLTFNIVTEVVSNEHMFMLFVCSVGVIAFVSVCIVRFLFVYLFVDVTDFEVEPSLL